MPRARGDRSASRPKHDPPCKVGGDGHIEGCNNEREVDEPSAGVEKVVVKREEKRCVKHG